MINVHVVFMSKIVLWSLHGRSEFLGYKYVKNGSAALCILVCG